LEKGNEVFELVNIEIVAIVVGTDFDSRNTYKLIVNGSDLKAAPTVTSRRTIVISR